MCRSRRPAAVIELGSQYYLRNNQRAVSLGHAADLCAIKLFLNSYSILKTKKKLNNKKCNLERAYYKQFIHNLQSSLPFGSEGPVFVTISVDIEKEDL